MELPRLPYPPPRALLPPPPAPPPRSLGPVLIVDQRRAGQLSSGWRAVFVTGWTGALLGIAAVWKASRIVGLSTWWLGPPAQARPIVVSAIPGLVALIVLIVGIRNVRGLPWIGPGDCWHSAIFASSDSALSAIGDRPR